MISILRNKIRSFSPFNRDLKRFHFIHSFDIRAAFSKARSDWKKTLFFTFLFLGFLYIFSYFFIFPRMHAFAAWYDVSWGYRKAITITNNGSTQTNYQVQLLIDTQTLNGQSKLQSDCDDMRFTDTSDTLLTYWIDGTCPSSSTSVWVTFPSLASGSTTIYMYYGNGSATSGTSAYTAPTGIDVGNGRDGAVTLTANTNIGTSNISSGRSCADGGDAVSYNSTSNNAAGQNTVVLNKTPAAGCLAIGDEVLIIDLQGTTVSNTSVGLYETARIAGTSAGTLTLNHNLANTYSGTAGASSQKIAIQRIPNYTNLTVNGGGTLTTFRWNTGGTATGGIIMFRATGTAAITGTLSVAGLGYTGGVGGGATGGGFRGESYDGTISTARGGNGTANGETMGGGRSGNGSTVSPNNGFSTGAGGGGGSDGAGNAALGGGAGGGGGGHAGGGGGGGSNMDRSTTSRDRSGGAGGNGGAAGVAGGGGGGGCYDSAGAGSAGRAGGSAGNAGTGSGCTNGTGAGGQAGVGMTSASGGAGVGNTGSGGGGGGGGYYGSSTLSTIFLGSGGGGGGGAASGGTGTAGAAGGGIAYVSATTLTVSGSLLATGGTATTPSAGGGKGGGGAGGSVYLASGNATLGSSLVNAKGGVTSTPATGIAIGGGGGDGRIFLKASSTSGSTTPTLTSETHPVAAAPGTEIDYATYVAQSAAGVKMYLKFDEGTGDTLYDTSGNSNNGTRAGATKPSWNKDLCISDGCLYYNGTTSSVTVATTLSDVYTVSMWVRPGTATSGALIDLNGSARVTYSGTGSTATITATNFTSPSIYVNGNLSSTLTFNQWQHVLIKTNTTISASAIKLGNYSTTYFQGYMDEVKLYNFALSDSQIKASYNSLNNDLAAARFGPDNSSLSSGLIGYWKLDETASPALESSGVGITGTWINSPTAASGKFGMAMSFDGTNDELRMGNPAGLTFTSNQDITISAWVYTKRSQNYILGRAVSNSNYGNYSILTTATGKLEYSYFGTTSHQYDCDDTFNTNQWNHITFTYTIGSGSTMKCYINGKLSTGSWVAGTGNEAPTTTGTFGFNIGTWLGTPSQTNNGYHLYGYADDVRIYNRTLTVSDVTKLYNWAPGPVAYFPLDEGAGTSMVSDVSGSGSTGTMTGSMPASSWITGKYGRALKFDGVNDYINVPYTSNLSLTGSFTIATWIRLDAGVVSGYSTIIGKDNLGATTFMDINSSEQLCANYYDSGTTELCSSTVLSLNTWYHVAQVFDQSNNTFSTYINGVKAATMASSAGKQEAGSGFTFGSYYGAVEPFNGAMDDVKIYNYARTQAQLVEDMNGGHAMGGSPVGSQVGYWKFDEGIGSTANDSSINRNNLNLSSASSWTNNGRFGKAWRGDGVGYLYRDDDADFDFDGSDDFTISVWVQATCSAYYQQILNKSNTNGYGIAIYTSDPGSDGRVGFDIFDGTNGDTISTKSSMCDAQWHHIAARKIGTSRMDIFFDGRLEDSKTTLTGTGSLANSDPLVIGNYDYLDNTDELENGSIDELKIYRGALSDNQIKVDYNRGKNVVMGALSTASDGKTPDNSASREYCVPGDTTSCSSPVIEYKMEENTGTSTIYDTSGNRNDGIMTSFTGNPWKQGKFGSALYFDDTDDRVLSYPSVLSSLSTMTGSVWINPSTYASGDVDIIYTFYQSTTNRAYLEIENNILRVIDNIQSDSTSHNTSVSPTPNKWAHVVWTADGTNWKIYVDGLLRNTFAQTRTIANIGVGATFIMSSRTPSTNGAFDGGMDELKIYDYIRSPAQIAWDYNKGAPAVHYKFDECTGSTIYNNAKDGNGDAAGNNGTLSIGSNGANTAAGTSCTSGLSTDAWINGGTGKFNGSIDFDGSDDFMTTSAFNVLANTGQTSTSVSWGGWFYPKVSAASTTIIEKATEFRLTTDSSSQPVCGIYYSGAFNDASAGSTALSLNTWNHVMCTYDGTVIRTYLNGILIGTTSNSNNIISASSILYVGENSSGAQRFRGQVDDLRIYRYGLNQSQIKVVYNGGSAERFGPATGSP